MNHGRRLCVYWPSRFVLVALATALLVAACGGAAAPDAGPSSAVGSGMGPGISVQEALNSKLEGPLLVNGYLWRGASGEVRLCSGLTDAVPPQCVAPSLPVRGADLSQIKDLRTAQDVTWSQQPVQLLGEMSNGTLVVSGQLKG